MKVKLNLSNFNNDFQSNSEITSLNSISDSLIPMGKSGIHIKKENRGKFTEYCGGKVTDACIRKAKASGNPKLVKRATFAANARKWKHQQGGTIANYQAKIMQGGGEFEVTNPEERRYLEWQKLSPEQKRERNNNIAKSYINRGPSISNYYNALKAYFGGFNPENPRQSTGAPTILPGRMDNVLLMEKEAPTMFKMLAENPQEMRELIREFRIGTGTTWSQVYKPFNGLARKIKTFLQSGDRNLLKELERWAVQNKNILVKPKDFSESSIVPKGYIKGSYPDKVADYTQRGLTRPKPMSDQQWGDPDFEDYGGYIDRITSLYKKGGKL